MELRRAAEAVRDQLGAVESRGKPADEHRDYAIRDLVGLFRKFADVPPDDYRGHAQDFALFALSVIKLKAPKREEKFWQLVPKELHAPRAERSPRR